MKPVIIIAIAFVFLIPVSAFAQEYLVSFQTDNDSYKEGDKITVSGNVRAITGSVDERVTIKIFYDDKERFKRFIAEKVTKVAQDGNFTKTFTPTMEHKSWREGKYRLEVSIGDYTEESWFHFNVSSNLENGCPRHFPVVLSDGLCYDLPEPEPEESEPKVCIALYDPVCGISGETFSNMCELESTGGIFDYEGECVGSDPELQRKILCGDGTVDIDGICKVEPIEEEEKKIPDWIKNNASWWAEGQIDDESFVSGIQYLIKEGIIDIPETTSSGTGTDEIPSWIKNNAGWWADGSIDDEAFIQGIQYLVEQGIIRV